MLCSVGNLIDYFLSIYLLFTQFPFCFAKPELPSIYSNLIHEIH